MIHVGVRQQHQIHFRYAGQRRGRRDQTLQAKRNRSEAQSHPIAEYGIGQNRSSVNFEENRTVAKPGGVESSIGPQARIGPQSGLSDGSAHIRGILFPEDGSRPIDEGSKSRKSSDTDASDQIPSAHTILGCRRWG